jgi:hypothetical protein
MFSIYNTSAGENAMNEPASLNTLHNTAFGYGSLQNNKSNYNTAFGTNALNAHIGMNGTIDVSNSTYNTAVGSHALEINTIGTDNTGIGSYALTNSVESFNTAIGSHSLFSNIGYDNTAVGNHALYLDTSGNSNTAIGANALLNSKVGSNNICIGSYAGSNYTGGESNNICIGSSGNIGESNVARIGQGLTNKLFVPLRIMTTALDNSIYNVKYNTTTGELIVTPNIYLFPTVHNNNGVADPTWAFGDTNNNPTSSRPNSVDLTHMNSSQYHQTFDTLGQGPSDTTCNIILPTLSDNQIGTSIYITVMLPAGFLVVYTYYNNTLKYVNMGTNGKTSLSSYGIFGGTNNGQGNPVWTFTSIS